MRRLFPLIIILLASFCESSAQAWHLAWSDEFNGPAHSIPSASDWNFIRGWGVQGNHEIQWYCQPGEYDGPCYSDKPNLYEDGEGHLVLHALHNGQRWSSARLDTQHKHAILYGRIEARLRMEPGAGFWPAFWTLGDNIDTVGWPASGEQDIMEWVQKYGYVATSATLHGPGYSGSGGLTRTFTSPGNGRIDDGNFHTYGMTWTKDRIEFYRDDPAKPFRVITPADLPPGTRWVYDHPFYIILNFAIGEAGFPGSTDATTPPSGKMWVDYVRLYQQ